MRLVKYSGSGTPARTVSGILRVWSFAVSWGAANATETKDKAITKRTRFPLRVGHAWLISMKILKWLLLAAVLIQFIPYGHTHTNPPTMKEPAWDSSKTRDLVHRACFDCHSNQTTFPWYSMSRRCPRYSRET